MRVLHVINTLGGSGGAEHGLVREAVRFGEGVEQLVVRLFEQDDLESRLIEAGIAVDALDLRGKRSSFNWPAGALKVGRTVRRFGPDVIHTSLFMGNLVGQLAAWPGRVPVVSTLTNTGDVELHRQLQPGAEKWRAAALRAVGRSVGRRPFVRYRAITHDVKKTNCDSLGLPGGRVTVIPRGVALDGFDAARPDRQRFGLPSSGPLLVNVGRQTAQKGHLLLLQAFERLLQTVPTARLAILGREGDTSAAIARFLRERRLESSVHLLGYRRDVPELLASADLFVFTSLCEGLGTAVLEAMGAGLPVLAFDIPPVREITDDGRVARLVPVGDTESFAGDAVQLLEPETGRSLGEAGRRWVRQEFDVDRVAARLLTLLTSAARTRDPALAPLESGVESADAR